MTKSTAPSAQAPPAPSSSAPRPPARRGDPRVALAVVAVFAGTIAALAVAGRSWISSSGHVALWTSQAWGSETSQQLLDPYSVTHALHGFVFFWVLVAVGDRVSAKWRIVVALVAEAVWEVVENSPVVIDRYRETTAALGYTGDSILNSFGDLLACALGFWVARRLGVRASIVVFAVAEILLLVFIRDSLLLSVVMLVFDVEAIQQWQMNH